MPKPFKTLKNGFQDIFREKTDSVGDFQDFPTASEKRLRFKFQGKGDLERDAGRLRFNRISLVDVGGKREIVAEARTCAEGAITRNLLVSEKIGFGV